MTRHAAPPVLPEEAAELAARTTGPVLLPEDEGYAAETAVFNLNLSLEPALVVGAANASDVQAAVLFAKRQGRPVAVKTSGHQSIRAGQGAVLITTERMNEVVVDADRRTGRVGSGVLWKNVVSRTVAAGLAPMSGSAPDVGVAAYTLGGGQSPVLGRTKGYAADHVRSLDVVTADGRLRHVTAENEPDLFWALRGGKGNFGVVTALEFDLFPFDRFYGGALYFPGEKTAELLHAWQSWLAGVPEEMSTSLAVQRLPPLPELPDPLRGAFVLHLRVAFLGSAAEGERLLAPLRAVAPALLDTVAEKPYTESGSVHLDPTEAMPYYDKTTMLREFPAEAADRMAQLVGPDSGCELVNVEIRHLGGAFDREPAVPNSVPMRGLPFVVFGFGVGGPDRGDVLRAGLAKVMGGMDPWADTRNMPNFLSADEGTGPEEVAAVYGAERYQRLSTLKRTYDPSNMFRLNHNIEPAPLSPAV